MPRRQTAAERAAIELRREKVAANLLAGLNYRDIAQALGVSLGTVAADAKHVFREWQKAQVDQVDQKRALEERRLDRVLNGFWNRAIAGDLGAVEAFRRLSESRRKLLGLDAPTQTSLTIYDAVDQLLSQLPADVRAEVVSVLGLAPDPSGADAADTEIPADA